MDVDPDSDIYGPDEPPQEQAASDPADPPEEDELLSEGEPISIAQMVQNTIEECPGAFMKFRVTNPEIIAKEKKKKAAAEKRKQTMAAKRAAKATVPAKRKRGTVIESEGEEEELEQPVKKKGKDSAAAEPEEVEMTAYIYVERPIPPAPTRSASSSRPHKPTDEEKYVARGLVVFTASLPYLSFIQKVAEQLPCDVEDIIQEKITWKLQSPMKSPYLSLSGEIGFASMVSQLRGRKAGLRVIMLVMPPPKKPIVEKPFWEIDDPLTTFNFAELDPPSTHGHVVEQKVSFDQSVAPHKEALLERYPENNHPLFPNKRIYTDIKMNAHWELTDMRLGVWASHLFRKTATLDKAPISSHFDYKSRILPPKAPAPLPFASASLTPLTSAAPVTPAPAPASVPLATPTLTALPPSGPSAMQPTLASGTSLVDIMLLNMIQQQQQQQYRPYPYMQPPNLQAPAAPIVSTPANVPAMPSQPLSQSVPSAPQSPAKFQLPDVSLAAFCERYNVNATDQERLEKLEFQPGDKIDNLPEADWKSFAGFTSLSWRRVLDKNHTFVRDARAGNWV